MGYVYQVCRSLSHGLAQLCFDYEVVNPERLDVDGPVLVAANHVSYLDPPLIGIAFRRELNYLGRNTLFSNPVARWLFPHLNVVPVNQEKAEVAPLKMMLKLLKEGNPCLIFPEGGRSTDGQLQHGEPGAGFVVAKSGVPVLPMRIFGAWETLPPGSAAIRPRKITVVAGNLLHFNEADVGKGKEAYATISTRIMEAISKLECPADRVPKPRKR